MTTDQSSTWTTPDHLTFVRNVLDGLSEFLAKLPTSDEKPAAKNAATHYTPLSPYLPITSRQSA